MDINYSQNKIHPATTKHGNETGEHPHYSQKILARWAAPEFEVYEKNGRWHLYLALILLAIIGYALYINSPLMAITFILIGVLGYIYANKEPRLIDFSITTHGMIAGREIYDYDNIESFWIFYDPEHAKLLSLKTKSHLLPFVHIPIDDQDPVAIRHTLMKFIPEVQQERGLIDTLERLLHI